MFFLNKIWKKVKWPLFGFGLLFIVYAISVVVRLPEVEEKNVRTVEAIHATRLQLADVEVHNLPPIPDPAENDATLEGIDANGNGIRDDVEHAIFKKYPSDKKLRAAALQYALELQMEFTKVFSKETLVAVIQEESRGSLCLFLQDENFGDYIDELVFNTTMREQFQQKIFKKYMTSYALPNGDECDISFSY